MTKPVTYNGDLANLPAALASLKERHQWAVWKWQQRGDGGWHKPPLQSKDPSRYASQDDPGTWSSFEEARTAVAAGLADGVTYMLDAGDGLCAIDIDHCRDPETGSIAPWAQYALDRGNSYVEVTPSGTGIRMWGTCDAAAKPLYKTLELDHGNGARIEIFRHRKKPLTVTGYDLNVSDRLADIERPIEWALEHGKRHKPKKPKASPPSQKGPTFGNGVATAGAIAGLVRGPLPEGTDRSVAFGHVVWHFYGIGKPMAEVVALLKAHPDGVAGKYAGRVEQEVLRLWEKAEERDRENAAARTVAGERPRRKFVLIDFADIELDTNPRYRIQGLLPDTGVAVVWGPRKCFKSFWLFDALMHVAMGWTYHDRKVLQGPVVYMALEGGSGFKTRVVAFKQHHRIADAPFKLIIRSANLPVEHADLIEDIAEQYPRPAVVVIDTLNRSIGGDENNSKDMNAFIGAADAVREAFDCLVIVVHHCGHEGTRPRGHSSLAGAADAQLKVVRSGMFATVTAEFMKDGAEGASVTCLMQKVTVGQDHTGVDIVSLVALPSHPDLVPADEDRPPGRRTVTRTPRSVQVLCDAVTEALAGDACKSIVPRPGSDPVRAVPLDTVREEFDLRYPTGEGDPRQQRNTRLKAWKRALEALPSDFGTCVCADREWIWRTP